MWSKLSFRPPWLRLKFGSIEKPITIFGLATFTVDRRKPKYLWSMRVRLPDAIRTPTAKCRWRMPQCTHREKAAA